jgi:heptosyltransferase-2
VVLHATSTNPAKTWPMRHFQALATALVLEHQATVFFLGTPQDKLYYETLCLELPDEVQGRCVNWCGETTLLDSMALLTGMSLVVANDSGMVHMAAATNVPLVALFGPMDPQQWRPLSTNATVLTHPDLTCRPCRMKITCSHQYPCLTELTPERVLQACKAYLTS